MLAGKHMTCLLVVLPVLALAQSPEVARDAEGVECASTETIGQCHARLGCRPNEELDQCQKRLLRCWPHETLEDCKKRLASQRREKHRERHSNQRERASDQDGRGEEREHRSHRSEGSHDFEANKTFGLGFELGAPIGINGKYFFTGKAALDFGLGFIEDYYYGPGVHLYGDFLYHPVSIVSTHAFKLPFYFGAGLRFWDFGYCVGNVCGYGGQALGIRVPLGISFDFNRVPLDVFIQVVPVIDFLFGDYYTYYGNLAHLGVDGSVGLRYWFK